MPVVIVSVFMMLIAAWASLTTDLLISAKNQRLAALSSGQALIASEVKRYHLETGNWPTNLANLSAQPGYEHLKQFVPKANSGTLDGPNTPYSLLVSNTLNNGSIQYKRVAIVAMKDASTSMASYLASSANTCNPSGSSADFYSTSNWCGSSTTSYWSKTDTVEMSQARESWAYKQQRATSAKITRYYRAKGTLPNVATATTLASLVTPMDVNSVVGTSLVDCAGQFSYQGVGFECGDLYNQFNLPVSYRKVDARHFELSSASQIPNASGATRTILTSMDTSLPLLVTQVAAGGNHTCALTTAGGVKCWGYNALGQLGNGSTTDSLVPVDVTGLTSGVVAISAGYNHTCAVTSSGGLKCWGNNFYGHLGNGTTTASSVPVDVSGLTTGVASVSAGNNFTCAVTTAGAAKCWGLNSSGQLGNGLLTNSSVPVAVTGLTTGVTLISAGQAHSCAIQSAAAKCWGLNASGQLGNGTFTNSATAVSVTGLTSLVTSLASTGAGHTCAIQSGAAKCWGAGGSGQLGNNALSNSSTAVAVSGLTSGVTQIAVGGIHSCAVASGAVKCWGQGSQGQMGNGGAVDYKVPTSPTGWTSAAASVMGGYQYTCAINTSNVSSCWGKNTYGEVGNGTTTIQYSPVVVTQ